MHSFSRALALVGPSVRVFEVKQMLLRMDRGWSGSDCVSAWNVCKVDGYKNEQDTMCEDV